MPCCDPIEIQVLSDRSWETYMRCHALQVNPVKSRESYFMAGEEDADSVSFRLRWCKMLDAIQFDKPNYRVIWRGKVFDIREYDDYMYQHRKVDLRCSLYG